MGLAISISWNSFRFTDGLGLLFEIKQLGFKEIELSFNLTSGLLDSIIKESRQSGVSICSLHNYCPIPPGLTPKQALPDCYSLAALDPAERDLAVKYTKASIDTASGLGAKAVVLHCGRVQIPDATRQLIDLYNQGLKDSRDFTELKDRMIRQRMSQAPAFLAQALKSLEELNEHARNKKVLLGVETRFYHAEIPDIGELGIIFKRFAGSQIYYWHDTGHAQLMENLGFARHKDFLQAYADRLIGVHLHDIRGCQDHLAPLSGEIDFSLLKPYLKKDTLKVVEAHSPATQEELVKSRQLLTKLYDCDAD